MGNMDKLSELDKFWLMSDLRSINIVERLQMIIDTADERELDETEVRAMRDAIDEIQRLRNVILDELSARDQELGLQ